MTNTAGRFTELRLALKLMSRELRSGELTLIFLALVLAVTVTTAIAIFSQRLDLAMQASANDMLGADLRVRSTTRSKRTGWWKPMNWAWSRPGP